MQATIHHKGETGDRFNEREVADSLIEGTVFKKLQGHYFVRTGKETVTCSMSNRLRKYFQYPTSDPASGTLRRVQKVHDIRMIDPVAVGDVVRYVAMDDGNGHIKDIAPRQNKLNLRNKVLTTDHEYGAVNNTCSTNGSYTFATSRSKMPIPSIGFPPVNLKPAWQNTNPLSVITRNLH